MSPYIGDIMRVKNYNAVKLIKTARKIRNMSQKDVQLTMYPGRAKNAQHISNIERGIQGIPPKMVAKLCKTLGIHKEVMISQMVLDYQIALIDEVEKYV
jgi:transcriptional regulator with XRE-family HTH domain